MNRSYLPLASQIKPQGSPHMPPGCPNSPNSTSHTNKTFVQVHIFQGSALQLRKPNRGTLQDITIKKRNCMKSPTPEVQCARCIFQKQYLLLTLQIKYQSQVNHDTTFENS